MKKILSVFGSSFIMLSTPGMVRAATITIPDGFTIKEVAAGFEGVLDIYRDPSGRLLVTELGLSNSVLDGRVVQINDDKTQTVISSGYFNPSGVLVNDLGTVFVSDYGPASFTSDNDGILWEDSGEGPVKLATGFTSPTDLVFTPLQPDQILMSELSADIPGASGDSLMYEVDSTNGSGSIFFNDGAGPGSSNLTNITGLALDASGNLYASDNGTRNVHRITSTTTQIPLISGVSPLITPQRIDFDESGNLFITDSDTDAIFRMVPGSTPIPFITNVSNPVGLLVEGDSIYFTESSTTVWKVSPSLPTPVPEPLTNLGTGVAVTLVLILKQKAKKMRSGGSASTA